MKLIVFADSHGRTLSMHAAIEAEKPAAVIHLGDHAEDTAELSYSYPNLTVYRVRGNNDYTPDVPWQITIAPGGVPMYVTHGHQERVTMSSFGRLPRLAREAGCRIALFGHTHRTRCTEEDGLILLNPGSISLPRGGPASYARIEAADGRIDSITILDTENQPVFEF